MQAGKLNRRIEIQSATHEQDSVGQAIPTWTTEASRWAAIQPLSGRELELAKQINAEVSHKITLRFFPGLTSQHRIKHGERIFEIVSVTNTNENQREHVVVAVEAV